MAECASRSTANSDAAHSFALSSISWASVDTTQLVASSGTSGRSTPGVSWICGAAMTGVGGERGAAGWRSGARRVRARARRRRRAPPTAGRRQSRRHTGWRTTFGPAPRGRVAVRLFLGALEAHEPHARVRLHAELRMNGCRSCRRPPRRPTSTAASSRCRPPRAPTPGSPASRAAAASRTGVPSVAPRRERRGPGRPARAPGRSNCARGNSDSSPGGMKPVIIVVRRSPSPAIEAE